MAVGSGDATSDAADLAAACARAFGPDRDAGALGRLARRHREEAKADPEWIHPSWLARAIQDESPAVRAAVATHGPPGVGRALRAAGGFAAPDRPPHPEVLAWVLSLWAERLVGGSPRDDHPPVVAALAGASPLEAFRLWSAVGRAKQALAREGGGPSWVREALGTPSDAVRAWALRDVEAVESSGLSGRRGSALLGLFTALRLLPECEPFDMRWALQRLPYPAVRRARAVAPRSAREAPTLARVEALILKAAWNELFRRGRIAAPHPAVGGGGR
ncbi:hypothetical protein [Paludisphaera soli]|uniref:hypothetical protein n=1 Tax=Paludisphaera soli TaxID=2712865 RepID=UPI0013EBA8B0|nr:hypothetical protein [Paludisphaera soli]